MTALAHQSLGAAVGGRPQDAVMDAGTALRGLMTAIDQKRWDDLESFLHPEFLCRYVHTGESFGRAEWIRVNRDYPEFAHLKVEELVASPTEAACHDSATGLRS